MKTQRLPNGLDYPSFPFPELQRVVTPHTYDTWHKYIYEIPLFSQTQYHLCKLLPLCQITTTGVVIVGLTKKEFVFSGSLRRQHYGKLTTNKLTECFQPNEFMYVCREEVPI
jgi:hypothetical protein